MFKRLLMAIKGKRNIGGRANTNSSSDLFLKNEALFVATKLQQATYKGEEFETYQKIMLKLKGVIDKG
tara:strand:+ start:198 stop:401 length:204 start_codon:yes stop_codon:yes gene_type:complete